MQTIYDAKILIVDDNQDLLNLVTTALRSTGYNQLTACTGCAAAQAAFAANRPDLMILDINLPDGDGFTLFRTLHSMADIPALFLSARDADADRLFGLGLGADDYLTTPFNILELKARIRALLRRAGAAKKQEPEQKLVCGHITLDRSSRSASREDVPVDLTAKEFDLMELLMRNPNRGYSRETLLDAIWGYDVSSEIRTVDVHIRRLREKLEKNPAEPDHIMTKWGVGYYFKP